MPRNEDTHLPITGVAECIAVNAGGSLDFLSVSCCGLHSASLVQGYSTFWVQLNSSGLRLDTSGTSAATVSLGRRGRIGTDRDRPRRTGSRVMLTLRLSSGLLSAAAPLPAESVGFQLRRFAFHQRFIDHPAQSIGSSCV